MLKSYVGFHADSVAVDSFALVAATIKALVAGRSFHVHFGVSVLFGEMSVVVASCGASQ